MSITTVKVLRTISKIVLLIVGIGIIGYGGLMIYKSVINKPQRVRITNVTDSAATITWVTDNPVRGVVYYRDEGTFLPGPLGFLGSKVAYDDRDFARAQDECVKAFNENAKNTKDEDFAVDGNNFDCENIPVEKLGAYYTHSVTIKNLNDSGTYFFVVGNGIWSWSVDGVDKNISENDIAVAKSFNFKTSRLLEEVPTPNIAYGTVYAGVKSEEGYLSESLSKDSLVFAYLTINGVNSQIISAVTNTDGGWIFDKSNFRDAEGNLITDLNGAIMMVCAQYEDVAEAKCENVSDGLEGDTELDVQGNNLEDLDIGTKNRILERFEQLVSKVYAVGPNTPCPSPLPNITDDSTYTCDKDCESNWSVSGCGVGSSCMKKCTHITKTKYGTWESTDWVKFGTVPGTCNVPGVCGECSDGDFEDNKQTCKYKICQAGNWSAWKDGLHDGSACSPDTGGGGNQCTSNCTEKDADKGCQKVSSNSSKQCFPEGNNCYKWKTYSNDNCGGGGGTTEKCTDGTEVGKCNSKGEKCITAGTKAVKTKGCYCIYNNTVETLPGNCVNGIPHMCLLVDNDSHAQSTPSTKCDKTVTCDITAVYGETEYDVYGDKCRELEKCVKVCTDGTQQTLSNNLCTTHLHIAFRKCRADKDVPSDKIVVVPLDPLSLNDYALAQLVEESTAVREKLEKDMENLKEEINSWTCTSGGDVEDEYDTFKKYCKILGGDPKRSWGKDCNPGYVGGNFEVTVMCKEQQSLGKTIIPKAYAEEPSSEYTLYLPEYGMYSFELGNYNLKKETTNGNTYYIFYIETNDKKGFQMPVDPDNPTEKEDIMLKSNSVSITYEKVSSAQTYTLVKGINLVSFNFIPVSTDLGPLTAKGVIEEAAKKDVTIQYISSFDGGRWAKGYTCKDDKCSGNDFNIIPGKGYLVFATKGGEMTIPGYKLKSSVPVNLSGGWNLVGIHGYTNAYTARTLIDSMNKIDGITANNVTWWPTSKGMYEGLQVTEEQQYGFDFPISPTNGYFVRISSFQPEDSKCKSLLWNDGGTLNGACGVTK